MAAPPIVASVLASPGQPLDEATRAFMQSRLGHDFREVRIHADARAAAASRAVDALAYTIGSHVVFGAGQYSPATAQGRKLLAHELTHVVQQRGSGAGGASTIGPVDDVAEREARSAAEQVTRGRAAPRPVAVSHRVQRMVFVTPSGGAADILGQFSKLCPGRFAKIEGKGAAQITASCSASDRTKNKSCECLCDVAHDTKRRYTINVRAATKGTAEDTLHDGKKVKVPTSTVFPSTLVGDHPDITMAASSGSSVEFGAFKGDGKPFWYDNWRILAHELCGHGRKRLTGKDSEERGCRPSHDATIDVENEIAAEHGGVARGKAGDPRQGESLLNPVGDRAKVLFRQCDGLHYEAP